MVHGKLLAFLRAACAVASCCCICCAHAQLFRSAPLHGPLSTASGLEALDYTTDGPSLARRSLHSAEPATIGKELLNLDEDEALCIVSSVTKLFECVEQQFKHITLESHLDVANATSDLDLPMQLGNLTRSIVGECSAPEFPPPSWRPSMCVLTLSQTLFVLNRGGSVWLSNLFLSAPDLPSPDSPADNMDPMPLLAVMAGTLYATDLVLEGGKDLVYGVSLGSSFGSRVSMFLANSTLSQFKATEGSGINLQRDDKPNSSTRLHARDTAFNSNLATLQGGAISVCASCKVLIRKCQFAGNSAPGGTGDVVVEGPNPQVYAVPERALVVRMGNDTLQQSITRPAELADGLNFPRERDPWYAATLEEYIELRPLDGSLTIPQTSSDSDTQPTSAPGLPPPSPSPSLRWSISVMVIAGVCTVAVVCTMVLLMRCCAKKRGQHEGSTTQSIRAQVRGQMNPPGQNVPNGRNSIEQPCNTTVDSQEADSQARDAHFTNSNPGFFDPANSLLFTSLGGIFRPLPGIPEATNSLAGSTFVLDDVSGAFSTDLGSNYNYTPYTPPADAADKRLPTL